MFSPRLLPHSPSLATPPTPQACLPEAECRPLSWSLLHPVKGCLFWAPRSGNSASTRPWRHSPLVTVFEFGLGAQHKRSLVLYAFDVSMHETALSSPSQGPGAHSRRAGLAFPPSGHSLGLP